MRMTFEKLSQVEEGFITYLAFISYLSDALNLIDDDCG